MPNLTTQPLVHASRCAVFAFTLLSASAAFAQFVWTDDKGVRQYSDRPPPASVPDNRILKASGMKMPETSTPVESNAESAAKETSKPQSLAERNADFQRRRAEQQEKEKKTAEEAQQKAERSRACESARNYQRVLESGERVSRYGANGEREFLDDSQRAQEAQNNRKMLENCK